MSPPFIFISCGQYTIAEKELGKAISKMVKELTGFEPFFAEEVQDLNGLDANILAALHDCAAFITILHPRGVIDRPGNQQPLVRASVWIEQEVAIATYIQRVEGRKIPIIAFRHKAVGLEGIRALIHLNPTEFTEESEILLALPERLSELRPSVKPIRLEIKSGGTTKQEEHPFRHVRVMLINDTHERISSYVGEVRVPRAFLKHENAVYPFEVKSDDPSTRRFRFTQEGRGNLEPHDKVQVYSDGFCLKCAVADFGGMPSLIEDAVIEAKVWIDGREYLDQKTIRQLANT